MDPKRTMEKAEGTDTRTASASDALAVLGILTGVLQNEHHHQQKQQNSYGGKPCGKINLRKQWSQQLKYISFLQDFQEPDVGCDFPRSGHV